MLVRDTMTGYLHEVPDSSMYGGFAEYPDQIGEGQVVFDGLGNPVGILPFLPAIAGLAAKALPAVTGLLSKVAPAVGQIAQQVPGMLRSIIPGGGPPLPVPALPFAAGGRVPVGWQRAPLPYTGLGPRRMYMRCAVWPGPAGLVPAHAAVLPPAAPAIPGAPGVAPIALPRRRSRGRRR